MARQLGAEDFGALRQADNWADRRTTAFCGQVHPCDSLQQHRLETLVGEGSSSQVFAIGDSQVIKLFRPGFTLADAETEATALRIAHALGVPTPLVTEVVKREDRYGIVLERINGPRLSDHLHYRPWALLSAYQVYAELFAKIHSCRAVGLPSQRELLLREIRASKALKISQQEAVIESLSQLPDDTAVCLKDFSLDNILMSKRGPFIVDWESACSGNPMADLALVSISVEVTNAHASYFRRLIRRACYKVFFERYFQLTGRRYEEIGAWRLPVGSAKLAKAAAAEKSVLADIVRRSLQCGQIESADQTDLRLEHA